MRRIRSSRQSKFQPRATMSERQTTKTSMVIIGAGQCGARTAHALRENGWSGGIILLGDEGIAPYERPPLSKAVLLGQKSVEECGVFKDAFFDEQGIDLRVDAPVARIDRVAKDVVLRNGRA